MVCRLLSEWRVETSFYQRSVSHAYYPLQTPLCFIYKQTATVYRKNLLEWAGRNAQTINYMYASRIR